MKNYLISVAAVAMLASCGGSKSTISEADKIEYTVEQFADLQILRYDVPGFAKIS